MVNQKKKQIEFSDEEDERVVNSMLGSDLMKY